METKDSSKRNQVFGRQNEKSYELCFESSYVNISDDFCNNRKTINIKGFDGNYHLINSEYFLFYNNSEFHLIEMKNISKKKFKCQNKCFFKEKNNYILEDAKKYIPRGKGFSVVSKMINNFPILVYFSDWKYMSTNFLYTLICNSFDQVNKRKDTNFITLETKSVYYSWKNSFHLSCSEINHTMNDCLKQNYRIENLFPPYSIAFQCQFKNKSKNKYENKYGYHKIQGNLII